MSYTDSPPSRQNHQTASHKLTIVWLALVVLTLISVLSSRQGEMGLFSIAFVLSCTGLKLHLVCSHYLEIAQAHQRIGYALHAFCYGGVLSSFIIAILTR